MDDYGDSGGGTRMVWMVRIGGGSGDDNGDYDDDKDNENENNRKIGYEHRIMDLGAYGYNRTNCKPLV